MYNFAPNLDGDIIDSKANLAATEAKLDEIENEKSGVSLVKYKLPIE